jgi:hypothetical protein
LNRNRRGSPNGCRQTFHFPNADAQQDALDKIARTVNRPNYAKAYSEGAGSEVR